jgi:TonB-dependent SusC/RagA subfamily outer membrane receptor
MRQIFLIAFALFLFCPGNLTAQKNKRIVITGKVTDERNIPVPGASIFIDNHKTDIVTDKNGCFRIKVNQDAVEILVFSLLAGAAEQNIGGRTEIDFILKDDSGTKETDQSITEKSKSLNFQESAVPVYQDIYDMIRGRFPGVEVSGKSIKIRGVNSLNISTEPLFVVDGVIVNEIADIDPVMVKSIEVLKGPDASVYGTRGSNGVIVITRKTGIE